MPKFRAYSHIGQVYANVCLNWLSGWYLSLVCAFIYFYCVYSVSFGLCLYWSLILRELN